MMHVVWWIAFAATIAVGAALNSMLVLGIMAVPLLALHTWLALKATR